MVFNVLLYKQRFVFLILSALTTFLPTFFPPQQALCSRHNLPVSPCI